jgi:hypothetical protein
VYEGLLDLGGEVWGDEPILESDPPRRLVHEWLSRYDDELAEEEPSRVTWKIEPQEDGTTLLTVVHERLEGAPKTAESVAGVGWMYVLSGLKTLLETGEPLKLTGIADGRCGRHPPQRPREVPVPVAEELHRRGQEDGSNDRRVDQHRGRESDARLLELE